MRALPLGFLPTLAKVKAAAAVQAKLTHNTAGGIASAQAVALMAYYGLRQRGSLTNLLTFLEREVPGHPWSTPWEGPVPLHGVSTVRAALTALLACRTQSTLLRTAVAFTGDTDSVAAIAVGAAACFPEYRKDLPATLLRHLENKTYGRDYLRALDRKLIP